MPATNNPIVVRGMRDLQVAFSRADRQTRLGLRKTLASAAEPVRSAAESLAVDEISRIGPKWSKMRIGVTRNVIYVAPKQRSRAAGPRRRPNLAGLLMDKAMEPALDSHRHEIEHRVERTLDVIATDFNGG